MSDCMEDGGVLAMTGPIQWHDCDIHTHPTISCSERISRGFFGFHTQRGLLMNPVVLFDA